jgi:hypothetical protein
MSQHQQREPSLLPGQAVRIDGVCDRFEQQWLTGAAPRIEEFLPLVEAADRTALLRELVAVELYHRGQRGERPTAEEYRLRFSDYAGAVDAVLAGFRRPPSLSSGAPNTVGLQATMQPGAASQPGQVPPTGCVNIPGYDLLQELGRGGMGVVYKARQLGFNRIVALKMILAGGHAGAAERVRFLTEAEAIAAVKHAGIVEVYDFGTHDGLPFFSLEFCEGGSLAVKLAENPLPPQEAARLVEQVARAVQAAHDNGIVHRDLKPGNIMLGSDGAPRSRTSVSPSASRPAPA